MYMYVCMYVCICVHVCAYVITYLHVHTCICSVFKLCLYINVYA